jgi:hypothetical protein
VVWTWSNDVLTTIGLAVGPNADVRFLVSERSPDDITLVIGDSVAEIVFDPSTVESLRDRADEAVRQSKALRSGVGP